MAQYTWMFTFYIDLVFTTFSLHFCRLTRKAATVISPSGYGGLGQGISDLTKTLDWQAIDLGGNHTNT